jgi:TonB family protein
MTDRFDVGDLPLPDDLRALHEELSSIRYEERPSFGPELRAELAHAWAEGPAPRPSSMRRKLAAAALAGLLVGGASVPSARASFVRLIGVLNSDPVEVEAPVAEAASAEAVAEEESPAALPVEEPVQLIPVPEVVEDHAPEIITETTLVAPQMLDRARAEHLLQDAYPNYLQRQGVGGTVWLRLWVDDSGSAGFAKVSRSSGIRDLDRAAVQTAPNFSFVPALQDGRRMGTWIEFPIVFEPDSVRSEPGPPPGVDPLALPTGERGESWELRDPLDLAGLPKAGTVLPDPGVAYARAEEKLRMALSDPPLVDDFGPLEAILKGEAPEGMAPTRWRSAVGSALERAIDQGMENPASLLAFGRIRLRQGLRAEARSLFERGLQMAVRDRDAVSPWTVAELHYERGTLVRDSWLSSRGVGRVRAEAFSAARCTQARSSGGAGSGFASAERLIAWNYLCPAELSTVFDEGFEVTDAGSAGDLALMMASFRAAVEAYPAHVGANTDLLVTLASEGRWEDVLTGARRFAWVTGGHPNGLLLAGVALHRLDRTADAVERFEAALARMPDDEADALRDIGFLLDRSERSRYRRLPAAERRAWEDDFWKTRDRLPSNAVNERRVEHLARTAYAQLRFGSVFGDAGEVWVRFGRPDSIHIVDEGSGRLAEFWDYGSGPDLTFVRWVASKRTDLTPEGRAYVDDLGKIFPPQ